MDNENKWEYDYSSQDKNESGDTGYPNVGSSGMNTANQYNDPQPEPETAYTAPQTDNGAGGATPPVHPVQPQDAQPPKKKKKFNGKRVARSAVALVLASADIHLTLSRCPDLEPPVGGQSLSLHLGYRCGLQRRLVLRRLLPLCRHLGGRHPRCDRRDNCQCQHAKNPPFVHEKPPRKLFCKQFTGWFCLMSTTIQ